MGVNRVFFPQEALDQWIEQERIVLDDDVMTLNPDGQRFRISEALRFMAEVAEGEDPHDLVGKVKSVEAVAGLGGEHYADSVILGDNAYEVVEGFVGEPIDQTTPDAPDAPVAAGHSLASATRAAVGDKASSDDMDPLTRFFLEK
ncbi:MAG: hypothetical protein PVI30_12185 [Myxococcales bacterium]|jgi:hypothetical protein